VPPSKQEAYKQNRQIIFESSMFPEQDGDLAIFQTVVGSWYQSLRNPAESQKNVLLALAEEYEKTRYGKSHNASEVKDIASYRKNFPVIDYWTLSPYLADVMRGNYETILPEPLLCWVMTRGSTGPAKVLPATRTHLGQVLQCGARALINHAIRKKDSHLLEGRILNLNFPTNVHTMTIRGETVSYGYSSGTYAKLIPTFDRVSLVPKQEEIDALGPGISRQDWDRRFELAYQQALKENVTAAMGVTPIILSFAKYVHKRHGKKPEKLWKTRALFCTSVRKIHYKYAPALRKYFGNVDAVEIYSATEGVFAQQLDDLPYVTPNYDTYLFEVETSKGISMLHELKRGEWGKLIISSCMFPRYSIGDLIEAAGKNYFRIIGRQNIRTVLEHRLYRLFFGSFV
jgi:hypothetical protein